MRSVSKARKARKRYMLPMGSEAGMSAGGPIQHGGDLARARALFPEAPEPWVDLSTGINPHSYPYSPLPANAFSRLPQPETVEHLRLLVAEPYSAHSAAPVVAAPGTPIPHPTAPAEPTPN